MQKTKMKKRCRDGVTCVVLCTLPSIYLVCVVFGTAIPTSYYILENVFHTCEFCHSTDKKRRGLVYYMGTNSIERYLYTSYTSTVNIHSQQSECLEVVCSLHQSSGSSDLECTVIGHCSHYRIMHCIAFLAAAP